MVQLFKWVSILEGISYILLLFVGVPMKYVADNPMMVKALGMPHGILFIAYVILAFLVKNYFKWDTKTFLWVLFASLLPFGTFYVHRYNANEK